MKNRSGVTLIENLVTIAMIGTLLVGIIGAFYVSRLLTIGAKHRMYAMSYARELMEKELAARSGGYGTGGYYTFDPIGDSTRTIDGTTYAATRYPYPAPTLYEPSGNTMGIPYTTIGFVVSWQENLSSSGGGIACNEKVVTHVARH